MAENAVRLEDINGNQVTVSGGALKVDASAAGGGTSTANQGTPAAVSNAWPIKVTNGSATTVGVSTPTSGSAGLFVCTGIQSSTASLNAVTSNQTGSTVDFGCAMRNISFVVSTTGSPTGGTVTLEVSLDNATFFTTSTTATVGSGVSSGTLSNIAFRYARTNLTGLTGGSSPTVTSKITAS